MAKRVRETEAPKTNQTQESQEPVIETVASPEESKEIADAFNQEPVFTSGEVEVTANTIELKPEPPKEEPKSQAKQVEEVRPELDKTLPFEDRILAFMKSRKMEGFIKLNDFLKSLYPLPGRNEPPVYLQQHESKKMRVLLGTMQATGKIEVRNNGHLKLGTSYTPESSDGNALPNKYYDLNSAVIEAALK